MLQHRQTPLKQYYWAQIVSVTKGTNLESFTSQPGPKQTLSEIIDTMAYDRLLLSLTTHMLYDKFNIKWQSQQVFKAVTKKKKKKET